MAGAAEGLIARRAALLVRCQEAREARRRAEAARAGRLCAAAREARWQARHAFDAHETVRAEELRHAYDAVTGREVSAAALQALPDLERKLRTQSAALASRVTAAEQALREAEAAEQAARQALAREARATQRRERLAQVTRDRHRRVLDAAEEMEREDLVADGWAPA